MRRVTDAYADLDPEMQTAARLVGASMAVDGARTLGDWLDVARGAGFEACSVEDLSQAIRPNLLKHQQIAERFFNRSRLAPHVLPVYEAAADQERDSGAAGAIYRRGWCPCVLGRGARATITLALAGASQVVSMSMRIRLATIDDARSIAELHIRSWQWAYKGLIPDSYLESLPTTLEQLDVFLERAGDRYAVDWAHVR